MLLKYLPLAFLWFPLALGAANAASFDCSKAGTPLEHLICATPTLSADDSQLGSAYEQALSVLPPAGAEDLRQNEKDWLGMRDDVCSHPNGSASAASCLDEIYRKRLADIPNLIVRFAFISMTDDPARAETIFENASTNLAKLGLALDLRLLLPNPRAHNPEIATLLNSITPPNAEDDFGGYGTAHYDGSVKSLVPYIFAAAKTVGPTNEVPVSCDLIEKYPILLDSTVGASGSWGDDIVPQVTCDNSYFQLDNAIKAYENLTRSLYNTYTICGELGYTYFGDNIYNNWIIFLFPEALLDSDKYDGAYRAYFRSLHGSGASAPSKTPGNPNEIPLARWTYSSPEAYRASAKLPELFRAARAALITRYETLFGFSKTDAELAAQRGVRGIWGAASWQEDDGASDDLAKAILANQPDSVLAPLLQAALKKGPLDPEDLADAVLDPNALTLLLRSHPDLNATDQNGLTPLMEAAFNNQPTSVKLLLASGANVNKTSDNAGDQFVNDDGICQGLAIPLAISPPLPRGMTALMIAAQRADLSVVQELVAAGADIKIKDADGDVALKYLSGRQNFPSSDLHPLAPADAAAANQLLKPSIK